MLEVLTVSFGSSSVSCCWGWRFFHVVMGTLVILAYVLGGIALVTSLVRFCTAWAIFGVLVAINDSSYSEASTLGMNSVNVFRS